MITASSEIRVQWPLRCVHPSPFSALANLSPVCPRLLWNHSTLPHTEWHHPVWGGKHSTLHSLFFWFLWISGCHVHPNCTYIVLSLNYNTTTFNFYRMHVQIYLSPASCLPATTVSTWIWCQFHLGSVQTRRRILNEGVKPFTLTVHHRVAIPLMQPVKEELERMEKLGVITQVREPTELWFLQHSD